MTTGAITFEEGGRQAKISVEALMRVNGNQTDFDIFESSLTGWLPPHESDVFTKADHDRIVRSICDELTARGITYTIE
ncbi:Imm74 family immunity protein [Planctopirus limnophila]|nr:Imm74 family immunity protein [Planctopirus limnophila]